MILLADLSNGLPGLSSEYTFSDDNCLLSNRGWNRFRCRKNVLRSLPLLKYGESRKFSNSFISAEVKVFISLISLEFFILESYDRMSLDIRIQKSYLQSLFKEKVYYGKKYAVRIGENFLCLINRSFLILCKLKSRKQSWRHYSLFYFSQFR